VRPDLDFRFFLFSAGNLSSFPPFSRENEEQALTAHSPPLPDVEAEELFFFQGERSPSQPFQEDFFWNPQALRECRASPFFKSQGVFAEKKRTVASDLPFPPFLFPRGGLA